MRSDWLKIKDGLLRGLGIFLALFISGLFLLFIYFFLLFDKVNDFAGKYFFESNELHELIKKGQNMSNNDALNYTMMYYDTFITILIALLGFSTVLVYFYIRGITRKEAEQEVSKAVNEFFFEKKESGKVLKSAAEVSRPS